MVVVGTDWWDSLPDDVRSQLATILNEVTTERNAAVGQVDAEARQAILDAGATIRELNAEQRQAWVDAMLPVWDQFKEDVGQENIDAAQKINMNF
jgi:C4-dicarboxylate-binding protein DctP